jgi:hypothetical protein
MLRGMEKQRREGGEVWVPEPEDVDIPDAVARDTGERAVVCGWAAVFGLLGLSKIFHGYP